MENLYWSWRQGKNVAWMYGKLVYQRICKGMETCIKLLGYVWDMFLNYIKLCINFQLSFYMWKLYIFDKFMYVISTVILTFSFLNYMWQVYVCDRFIYVLNSILY